MTMMSCGTTLFSQDYTLTVDGQRDLAVEVNNGQSSTVDRTYDGLNRLTGETRTGANANTIAWTLDEVGNRLTETRSSGTKHYAYDDNDRLEGIDLNNDGDFTDTGETTLTYDENGSTTSEAVAGVGTTISAWDVRNRLVSYNAPGSANDATYVYNYAGNRVAKGTASGTTFYVVDNANPTGYSQVIEEQTSLNAAPARTYILGSDVIGQDVDGTRLFHVSDGLGSTRAVATVSGVSTEQCTYEAFGTAIGFDPTSALTRLLYTGELYDTFSACVRSARIDAVRRSSGSFLGRAMSALPFLPPSCASRDARPGHCRHGMP